jgi:hypothetical protein
MLEDVVSNATQRVPPTSGNRVGGATLAASTASSAIELGKGAGWYTIACSSAFNLLAGDASVSAPADLDVFAAGGVDFYCTDAMTYVRIIITAGGDYQIHKSSRGKE